MVSFVTGGNVLVSRNVNSPWTPITLITGTNNTYDYSQGGLEIQRSNSGVAMLDTLPDVLDSANSNNASESALGNGWFIVITNADTTATLTLDIPGAYTLNGSTANVILTPNQSMAIRTDGANFFAAPPVNSSAAFLAVTGSPYAFGARNNGQIINRSNAGVAMADTLPNANTLPAGFTFLIRNTDASATCTITPATSTINGGANLAITFGKTTTIWSDGANYWASTPA